MNRCWCGNVDFMRDCGRLLQRHHGLLHRLRWCQLQEDLRDFFRIMINQFKPIHFYSDIQKIGQRDNFR